MKYSGKRRLVMFLKKYNWAKRKAKHAMEKGDLNNYISELLQVQASRRQLLSNSES